MEDEDLEGGCTASGAEDMVDSYVVVVGVFGNGGGVSNWKLENDAKLFQRQMWTINEDVDNQYIFLFSKAGRSRMRSGSAKRSKWYLCFPCPRIGCLCSGFGMVWRAWVLGGSGRAWRTHN